MGREEMFCGAVVAILAHLAYANVKPNSFTSQIAVQCVQAIAGALRGDLSQRNVFKSYHEEDEAFSSYADKGNVTVRFVGFDSAGLRDKDFIEFCYFRGVYAIYPHRVYCGRDKDGVNSAGDILKMPFAPDEQWLDTHNVVTVVTYRVDEKGELVHETKRRIISKK